MFSWQATTFLSKCFTLGRRVCDLQLHCGPETQKPNARVAFKDPVRIWTVQFTQRSFLLDWTEAECVCLLPLRCFWRVKLADMLVKTVEWSGFRLCIDRLTRFQLIRKQPLQVFVSLQLHSLRPRFWTAPVIRNTNRGAPRSEETWWVLWVLWSLRLLAALSDVMEQLWLFHSRKTGLDCT